MWEGGRDFLPQEGKRKGGIARRQGRGGSLEGSEGFTFRYIGRLRKKCGSKGDGGSRALLQGKKCVGDSFIESAERDRGGGGKIRKGGLLSSSQRKGGLDLFSGGLGGGVLGGGGGGGVGRGVGGGGGGGGGVGGVFGGGGGGGGGLGGGGFVGGGGGVGGGGVGGGGGGGGVLGFFVWGGGVGGEFCGGGGFGFVGGGALRLIADPSGVRKKKGRRKWRTFLFPSEKFRIFSSGKEIGNPQEDDSAAPSWGSGHVGEKNSLRLLGTLLKADMKYPERGISSGARRGKIAFLSKRKKGGRTCRMIR